LRPGTAIIRAKRLLTIVSLLVRMKFIKQSGGPTFQGSRLTLVITVVGHSINHILVSCAYRTVPHTSSRYRLPSRQWISPKTRYIPPDVDLMFPALVLLLDFYGLEEKYARKQVTFYAPLMSIVFAVWYGGFIEYLATFNHQYKCVSCDDNSNPPFTLFPANPLAVPYPFLECPFRNRVVIYAGLPPLATRSLDSLKHPGNLFSAIYLAAKS
jgi:hypothetical protein